MVPEALHPRLTFGLQTTHTHTHTYTPAYIHAKKKKKDKAKYTPFWGEFQDIKKPHWEGWGCEAGEQQKISGMASDTASLDGRLESFVVIRLSFLPSTLWS